MWLVSRGTVAGNLPIRLEPGEYIVGRAKDAAVVIQDLSLSRRHARLVRGSNSLSVEDLDSRNGTFVNGEQITRQVVELGDLIRFGGVDCRLSASPLKSAADFEESETSFTAPLPSGSTMNLDELTRAQLQVMQLVLQGFDEATIANRLNRSIHTIHTHLKAIFRQFDVHSRAELIAKAMNPRGK